MTPELADEAIPIFVPSEVISRVGGDMALLRELIELFRDDSRARLAELHNAIAASDAPAIARLAHTLKGAAMNFSAPRAQSLLGHLEEAARRGDLTDASAVTTRIAAAITELNEALGTFLAATPDS